MRFFLLLIFLVLCLRSISYAQPPDHKMTEVPGDTIEGESTDSTVVYIIKKAPVRIKERIEVQRSKLKTNIYYSIGGGVFTNSNTYKQNSGTGEYIARLNSSTNPKMGYTSFLQLYNAPQKNILGLMLEGKRIQERFHYTSKDEPATNTFENSYSYGSFGVMVGRWFRKDRGVSYQIIGTPTINYKAGVSGYSLNQANAATIFIESEVAYHKMYFSLYLTGRILVKTKESFIELAPYANLSPFSMTKKTEAFSIKRQIIGISFFITRRIF